jgi:hypothetical protein
LVSVSSFGATGDGIHDDYPAVAAALAQIARHTPVPAGGEQLFVPGSTLYFPPGKYFLSQTLSLKQQVRLLGETRGNGNGLATTLVFPPNVTGILVNRHNTEVQTGTAATSTSAEGSVIEGIAVVAKRGADPASEASGIHVRARCRIEASHAEGFARHGIAIVADESGNLIGNANSCAIRDCTVQGNGRHGLLIYGNNANACVIDNLNAVSNGGYGWCDASPIGQTWIGGHSASNGQLDSGLYPTTSIVWHEGGIYAIMPSGVSAGSRTPPGSDPRVWSLRERTPEAFPNIPRWGPGIPLCDGGAAYIGGGRHIHLNAYTEGRQGPYYNDGAIVLGGSPGAGFVGRGINIYATEGHLGTEEGRAGEIDAKLREAWEQIKDLGRKS